MKKICFLLSLLVTVPMAAQNCSVAEMNLTGINNKGCAPAGSPPYNPGTEAPVEMDFTWYDVCTNTITGQEYYHNPSTVAGHGQCVSEGYVGPGGSLVWSYCYPANESEITLALSEVDYNRMYNRAYDNYFSSGGVCSYTGLWRQDFQQCAGVTCPAPTGCCIHMDVCGGTSVCSGVDGKGGGEGGLAAQGYNRPCTCVSGTPIIIDTTGNGFHLTSAEDGVLFPFFGRQPMRMAWTARDSGNGFLALDRNGNGRIDDGSELFGNLTPQPKSGDPNGYRALAVFDENGDGIIDQRDAVYSKLVIWIDANHDGISQPEELHSLPSMGVYSIALRYQKEPTVDQYGNAFRYRGVLNPNPLDGTSRDGRYTYDVFFQFDKSGASAGCPQKIAPVNDVFLKEILR